MNEFDYLLKNIADGLRALAQGIDSAAKQIETMSVESLRSEAPKPQEKTEDAAEQPAETKTTTQKTKKTRGKVGRPKKSESANTAIKVVLKAIQEADAPIDIQTLSEKTGYDHSKIHNIVYRLRKQNKIVSESKGIYRAIV